IAVSEILVSGKASVLVPSPNVTNDHQYKNAKAVADEGAALLLRDAELEEDPSLLRRRVTELLGKPGALEEMRRNASRIAKPDAAEKIYQGLEI
ncbi:MAG: UDP-N-acetylglucosamine--N-acetylmuramyl-(pentapeptide) pyrophosphoryl-undecaprenol N-acetylglucosamine transferase, partial [Firmicutes bacterium]|nr:UDP-N-acetylglucosamine--N-acetylmuramyl-(pentapeptide) pyrophosphoryl-undecaprenol N-acetylglucosamine transferase [Bacillota bacterium]